jgi:hypothetical protein
LGAAGRRHARQRRGGERRFPRWQDLHGRPPSRLGGSRGRTRPRHRRSRQQRRRGQADRSGNESRGAGRSDDAAGLRRGAHPSFPRLLLLGRGRPSTPDPRRDVCGDRAIRPGESIGPGARLRLARGHVPAGRTEQGDAGPGRAGPAGLLLCHRRSQPVGQQQDARNRRHWPRHARSDPRFQLFRPRRAGRTDRIHPRSGRRPRDRERRRSDLGSGDGAAAGRLAAEGRGGGHHLHLRCRRAADRRRPGRTHRTLHRARRTRPSAVPRDRLLYGQGTTRGERRAERARAQGAHRHRVGEGADAEDRRRRNGGRLHRSVAGTLRGQARYLWRSRGSSG